MLKNKVKEYRQAKQISKANLAREIGVCRSYVTKLERGGLQPSGEVMFRIAAYFKGRIEDIFERVGGNPHGSIFLTPNRCLMSTLFQSFSSAPAKLVCNQPATLPARPAGMEQ